MSAHTAGAPRAAGSGDPTVLLVDPYFAHDDPMERKFIELYPSLSLLTLSGWLREHGVHVSIADQTFRRSLGPLRRELARDPPELVGVHTKTLTFPRALEVARAAHAVGSVAVAGGPDSATRPEAYLEGGFDAVVLGEGELTLTELAHTVHEGRPIAGTPGTAVLHAGRLRRGPTREFLPDLDILPLPAWDLIDMEGYLDRWRARTGERRAAVLSSRGCPFDCSWCSKPTFGRTFRQQSPERVLREVVALKERYGVDYVRFCDDVFGIQRRWLEQLLDGMIERRLDLKFECLARVDLLKPELLGRMRRAGLTRVYVGVESGSQKMLDLMNRGTRLAQVAEVSRALREHGVRQFWFLMLGYPGETMEDLEATVRLFRQFSPEEYSVSLAVPVPGTRLFDAVKDRLRSPGRRGRRAGGRSLLYEAAYPESVYHWQQARIAWEANLDKLRGRLSESVLDQLRHTADRFHEEVATPLLLGTRPPRAKRPPGHGVWPSVLTGRRPSRPAS